jgi:hypothetical protein
VGYTIIDKDRKGVDKEAVNGGIIILILELIEEK